MNEHEVHQNIVSNRKRKRLGRGTGSGTGKTAGRGSKGHKSRSGYSRHPIFNGGDLPMIRRIPKRGFNNRWADKVFAVNIGDVCAAFDADQEITTKLLKESGFIKVTCDQVKILGEGTVDKPLKLVVTQISESARQKVEAAGGSVRVVWPRLTPRARVAAKKKAAEAAKSNKG